MKGRPVILNKLNVGIALLIVVTVIAVFTAIAHMSCLFLGEACFRAQMAPEVIVRSSIEGTWVAPVGTMFVSSLFLLCAVYALSAANYIRTLPLLKLGIYFISGICILRGLATLPLSLMFPDKVSVFSIVAGLVWFLSGLFCVSGYLLTKE